ncbi:MAG: DinB family protein [Ardenticatenales bacterium]|nr:DinB family protein [Ardenticatenales bacterium]
MNLDAAREQLAANADAIAALVRPVDGDGARWKPSPEAWTILEVVCHLADEERDDFRTRVALTLQDPTLPWPPIDPGGWVTARDYASRDLGAALADFLAERERSLAWLGGLASAGVDGAADRLVDPAWDNAARHPAGFTIRAGDLMASWLAHDLLHVRQIVELRYGAMAGGVDGAVGDGGRDDGGGANVAGGEDAAAGEAAGAGAGDGGRAWDVRYAGEW